MPSVQRVQWARFRVIVTALVGVTILSTLLYLLTGSTMFQPQTVLYVYLPDGTGLGSDSPVRVDGIQVGMVESVALSGSSEPDRVVKVTMIVERDRLASITEDSTAQTAADTLVGDKFIQISTGRSPRRIQPGSVVPFKSSPDLVRSIDLSTFRQRLDQMDAILTEIEQGRSPLGQFVIGDQMYNDIRLRMGDLARGIRAATSTTTLLGRELFTETTYRQISEPLRELDESLAKLHSGQGGAGEFLRDNAQYEQFRGQVETLRKTIGDLRASEFLTSGTLYDDWNRMVAGWIRNVDEFNTNPMLNTTIVYDNINGMAKELQGTVKDFRENPRKFLRIKVF